MATTDPHHNPSGKDEIEKIKIQAAVLSGSLKSMCAN